MTPSSTPCGVPLAIASDGMDDLDHEIARLTVLAKVERRALEESWCKAEPLFWYAKRDETKPFICGCLTQVHGQCGQADSPELTQAIRADDRIPDDKYKITIPSLQVFAEWRRRIRSGEFSGGGK